MIEGFVLDFYCPEIKLGIEVDGSAHRLRKEYDRQRQAVIESEGITMIRITNKNLMDRKRSIIDRLNKTIA